MFFLRSRQRSWNDMTFHLFFSWGKREYEIVYNSYIKASLVGSQADLTIADKGITEINR